MTAVTTAGAPTRAPEPREPGSARRAVSDATTLATRVLLYYRHSPGLVGVSLAAPLLMLVVFGYVFGSAIRVPGGGDYRTYLIPGLFVLTAVNSVLTSMTGIARDVGRGMTDRLRSLPISRAAVLLGLALADVLVSLVVLALMVGVGLAVGWRAYHGVADALAALGLLVLFRFVVVWVGFVLGLLVGREETAGQLSVAVLPLGTFSTVFVPATGMPGWLRAVADWNPISAVAAACRHLFGDGPPAAGAWPLAHPVAATLGWSVLLLAVFLPLAVHRFHHHGR